MVSSAFKINGVLTSLHKVYCLLSYTAVYPPLFFQKNSNDIKNSLEIMMSNKSAVSGT